MSAIAYESICASSTVLSALTWTSSILGAAIVIYNYSHAHSPVLVLTYFLTLFYLAVSHVSIYGGIWGTTVYQAPWFIERATTEDYIINKPHPKPGKQPWENPAFECHQDGDNVADRKCLAPPHAPFPGNPSDVDVERLSVPSIHFRSAPSPACSQESLRPQWAKRTNTRRGVDMPFAPLPVAQRVSRLIKSCWSASSLPPSPPPKPNLPEPSNLNGGFLDCHRTSYGFFPDRVEDVDKPIRQTRMSEWVQARR